MAEQVPDWVTGEAPDELRELLADFWREPWEIPIDRDGEGRRDRAARLFLRRCWRHGLVVPHFTRDEAASKNRDGVRPVPADLRRPCQNQGIHLERLRHALGQPVQLLSWYRDPEHNREVGGATNSQHLYARACDFPDTIDYRLCRRIWPRGGIGTFQGRVRHADCRGTYAEWSYG